MRCEVVAIGTELLLGQIVDTNSSWLGEQLALAGIDSHFQTKVGDNHERIVASLRLALSRSDAVIVCGGLGPTQDDITREAIAEVMGVALERHPEIGERIRARFAARGRRMPENNLRQATFPSGPRSSRRCREPPRASICPVGAQVIYAVPGVPYELREMFEGTILADLRRRAGLRSVIKSRVLRTWGESESGLAETLGGRIAELDRLGNPTLAFLASGDRGHQGAHHRQGGPTRKRRKPCSRKKRPGCANGSGTSCSRSTTTTWSPPSSSCSRPGGCASRSPRPRPAA